MKAAAIFVIVCVAAGAPLALGAQRVAVVSEGKVDFKELCSQCHGSSGKGNGPMAATLRPAPADLTAMETMFGLEEDYMQEIIQGGGMAVGKSPLMPAFWGTLDPQRVENVIAYVRTLHR